MTYLNKSLYEQYKDYMDKIRIIWRPCLPEVIYLFIRRKTLSVMNLNESTYKIIQMFKLNLYFFKNQYILY